MNKFYGRNNELKQLIDAYNLLDKASIISIVAPSGCGKTRLIHEFYNSIVRDSCFWEVVPCQNFIKEIYLTPRKHKNIEDSCIDSLFLVSRALDKTGASENYDFCFDRIRGQFAYLLPSIIKSISNRKNKTKITRSALSLLLNFTLPGSSNMIELLNTVKDCLAGSFDAIELVSGINDRLLHGDFKSESLSVDVNNILEGTINVFNEIYLRWPDLKSVIIIEDIHWIDNYSCLIIEKLYEAAVKKNWPILFIFSGWDESLIDGNDSFNQSYSRLMSFVGKINTYQTIRLAPISVEGTINLIKERLCGEKYDFLLKLYEKSMGDLDLLSDYLAELEEIPGLIDSNKKIVVDKDILNHLPSRSVELAKLRLRRYPEEIKDLLYWCSCQGAFFDELFLENLLKKNSIAKTVTEELLKSDVNYGLTYVQPHSILKYCGEFRKVSVFQACLDIVRRSPNSNKIWETLVETYLEFFASEDWKMLSPEIKNRYSSLFNSLCERLKLSSLEILSVRDKLLLQSAENKLLIGDNMMAISLCESVITHNLKSDIVNSAYNFLVDGYYYAGMSENEYRAFRRWNESGCKNDFSYSIKYAKFLRRKSQTQDSIDILSLFLNNMEKDSLSNNQKLEIEFELLKSLWSHGSTEKAYNKLKEIEFEYKESFIEGSAHSMDYHTAAYLISHDMEKGRQAAIFAKFSMEDYLLSGNLQQYYIYKINYADSLFGLGYTQKAKVILEEVANYARDNDQPQILDIALISLGNIYSYLNEDYLASKFYEEGISIAKKIEHDWDYLYGCVFYNLHKLRNGYDINLGMDNIDNYVYLKELANIVILYGEIRSGNRIDEFMEFSIPVVRLHYRSILYAIDSTEENAERFARELGNIEGCKFYREVIFKSIEDILQRYPAIGCYNQLELWYNQYDSRIENLKEVSLSYCDYKKCEAVCCYDGVYLQAGEAEVITNLVNNNREFFSFLPEEYIVSSKWGDSVSGEKTAVKYFNYTRNDFPQHFNRTRCVFALDDGSCSLQSFAIKNGIDQFLYKPIACKIFPLETSQDGILNPLRSYERDKYFTGVSYPGYTNYTPCGVNRCDGDLWTKVLKLEVDFYNDYKKRKIESRTGNE